MLSEAQIEHYFEHGFVVPDYRLEPEVIESIRDAHDRLVAGHPDLRDYCPNVLAYDLGFLNYARDAHILDMVEQLIGPDFALWNSSFFAKPALNGHKTPWHQDGEYWPIRPIATCTVWMAIDASTIENGCLRVVRGSHRERRLLRHHNNPATDLTLNQELDACEYREADAVDIVLEEGQMSLHDVYLVHGSEANHSSRPRRGMTLRFMPTTSVFDRELAHAQKREKQLLRDHADRTLFLMRGEDKSGRNDFRMRW